MRDGILELVRSDIREQMGQRALLLSSNFARSVIRLDGVLNGDDALMESEMRRVIKDTDAANRKQVLARYAVLRGGKRPDGEAVVALQLGVILNPRVRDLLRGSSHIPDTLLHGVSLPVRTIIPRKALTREADQLQVPELISQLLYGSVEESGEMNPQQPAADSVNAYVTGMNMAFKQLHRPPGD